MRAPRWYAKLKARTLGYFWLSCPTCGEYFGGHEWRSVSGASIPASEIGPNAGTAICPACTAKGVGERAWLVP